MNAPKQHSEETTKLIHAAVKFALNGKRDESWTSKHQIRAMAFIMANENGSNPEDYFADGVVNPTIEAMKFFGNASANRQTLEKAKVIDETTSKGPKRSNLFAGFES